MIGGGDNQCKDPGVERYFMFLEQKGGHPDQNSKSKRYKAVREDCQEALLRSRAGRGFPSPQEMLRQGYI